jgi:hypothetical protein
VASRYFDPVEYRSIGGLFGAALMNSQKTHCKAGHEFTDKNTYVVQPQRGTSYRACRKCRARRMAELKRKRRLLEKVVHDA